MKNIIVASIMLITSIASAEPSTGCHMETRYRTVMKPVTEYQSQVVTELACGFNAFGVYGCAPISHVVQIPVTIQVPVQEAYEVMVCE